MHGVPTLACRRANRTCWSAPGHVPTTLPTAANLPPCMDPGTPDEGSSLARFSSVAGDETPEQTIERLRMERDDQHALVLDVARKAKEVFDELEEAKLRLEEIEAEKKDAEDEADEFKEELQELEYALKEKQEHLERLQQMDTAADPSPRPGLPEGIPPAANQAPAAATQAELAAAKARVEQLEADREAALKKAASSEQKAMKLASESRDLRARCDREEAERRSAQQQLREQGEATGVGGAGGNEPEPAASAEVAGSGPAPDASSTPAVLPNSAQQQGMADPGNGTVGQEVFSQMEKDRIEKATQTITEKLQEGDAALERDDIMGAVTAFAAAMQIYETMTAPTSLALAELESAQIPRGLGSQARIKLQDAQELLEQRQAAAAQKDTAMKAEAERLYEQGAKLVRDSIGARLFSDWDAAVEVLDRSLQSAKGCSDFELQKKVLIELARAQVRYYISI